MGPARGGGGVKEGQDRNEESGDLHEPAPPFVLLSQL